MSYAEEFQVTPEFGRGLLIYKPVNIIWQDMAGNTEINYVKTASIALNVLNCEQRYIPLKIIYDSEKARNSYSGYYQIDNKRDSEIKLNILNVRLDGQTIFNHIEVDSTYAKCLGDVRVSRFSENPFILKLHTEKSPSYAWNEPDQDQGKPVIFEKIYSNYFKMAPDSSFYFKGLVIPPIEIRSEKDWYRIGDPVTMNSKFEKTILGRPLICAVTNELASIDRYPLRRGDSIRIVGKVSAGSVFFTISRVGGGIVKITVLNRGIFADEFRVSTDGDYNISLSSNMPVYNYPYLDFKFSLWHLN